MRLDSRKSHRIYSLFPQLRKWNQLLKLSSNGNPADEDLFPDMAKDSQDIPGMTGMEQ